MFNQLHKNTCATKISGAILVAILFFGLLISKGLEAKSSLQGGTATPEPFLSAMFYGQEDVWQVFDHELPLGENEDNNEFVLHYDGARHYPVTPTPNLTATPTLPTPGPYIPGGYGYDQHGGIDYSLEYEPVLASASGIVMKAGWSNPANHRAGYGLHVVIDHSSQEAYETWYGHLSAITVATGDEIIIDPDDPANRNRIIGISGNTGSVFNLYGDCASIPSGGATCGQHLHFEVRVHEATPVYKPVNPYGWIGTTTPDPWATHASGATSYNLWATRPAVSSGQYGTSGPSLPEPEVNDINLLIDDSSSDFVLEGNCFTPTTGAQSYNNTYYYAPVDGDDTCWAQWLIEPDAFTPPGEYDIYVHIPDDEDASLDSIYEIEHHGQTSQAHVAQLVYPNEEHNAWAYIGRYDFALDGSSSEYMRLKDNVADFEDTANDGRVVLADAIRLVRVEAFPPPAETLYFSWANDVIINGTTYREEDIVAYDPLDGSWSLYFDGSDVGLEDVDVDAFTLLADGDILFSIDETIEGLGAVEKAEDTDIIRFIPLSTGSNTEGDFELYLTGSDFGLDDPVSGPDRDIDAIGFIPGGELLISTTDDVAEWNVGYFSDEDLIYWDPTGFVPAWMLYFDGSDVGLTDSGEDVNGMWLDPDTGEIYLTTAGSFSVTSLNGNREDLFICVPESIGGNTSCDFVEPLYWNGAAHDVVPADGEADNFIVDGFAVVTPDCEVEINGSFERRFACWTEVSEEQDESDWLISTNSHTGLYSAEAFLYFVIGSHTQAKLTSDPLSGIGANLTYCASLYARDWGNTPDTPVIRVNIEWYDEQGTIISSSEIIEFWSLDLTSIWQFFNGSATAPAGTDSASLVFNFSATSFTEEQITPYSMFIDNASFGIC